MAAYGRPPDSLQPGRHDILACSLLRGVARTRRRDPVPCAGSGRAVGRGCAIDARGGKLVSSSAARLWEHSDKRAQLCAAPASGAGHDAFEAYLSGLAHNAVWTAVLRAMDEVEDPQPWRLDPAFVAALRLRRDRLFAIVARQWRLVADAPVSADDAAQQGARDRAAATLQMLDTAERLAWLLCCPDRARAAQSAAPWLSEVDAPLRACYEALEQAPAA